MSDTVEDFFEKMRKFDFSVLNPGIVIVEDNGDLRMRLVRHFRQLEFNVYAAPNFDEAEKLIDFYRTMHCALIDDKVPQQLGGAPEELADRLYDCFVEKFSGIKVFAFAEEPEKLQRAYKRIIPKITPVGVVATMIAHDYAAGEK